MTTFKDIVTDEFIQKAIDNLGFTKPTPIQAECIPPGLEGKDLIGQAKTGSGKTFAFGIPILHILNEGAGLQAIILAPTRELCVQISEELKKLAKYTKARIATVYGGVSINPQIRELISADICVATPGRFLDHLERNTIHVDKVKNFILDEADRMLDMGFIDDIERIIQALPRERQTWLFSATMPQQIKEMSRHYLYEPVHIKTSSHVEEELLPQYYYVTPHNRKFSLLVHIIETEKPDKTLIFCGTRRTAEAVARNMRRHDMRAEELHGGLSQAKREVVMDQFKKNKIHLLIATDVAARGLDISNISHVINYDVPQNPEDYIHRIGRTARAGKKGKAITILEERDFNEWQAILDIVPQQPDKMDTPEHRNVGFRRHEDQGYGRGPPNRGPGGPRRGPPRGGPRKSSPRTQSRAKKRESGSGWKQSMRR
ncbi:DEAD/DEAH box helicase [Candidatus Woesearchaeota archaeon]|nr:DEAD/DEAH box helicase [Candidatus Woesearchaeota archaeon]